jgi:hypothetical protein
MITSQPGARRTGDHAPPDEPTSGLLSRLLNDSTALAKNEIALAKAEFSNSLTELKLGIASFATAGAVLLAGFLALLAAAIIALTNVMPWWAAALLAGVALSAVGLLLLVAAKRKLTGSAGELQRTQDSLHKDAAVVARRT